VLIELLKNVEKRSSVLKLLFVLNVDIMFLFIILFTVVIVDVLGELCSGGLLESLWLIVSWVDLAGRL